MAGSELETRSLCQVPRNDEIAQSPQQSVVPLPPLYSEIPGTVPLSQARENSPPPSYDDIVNPEAPPPSYHSLFGQVREARKNSSGILDFLRKVIIILLGTLGCTVIVGVTVIIPFTMIIIGVTYLGDCPVEKYIPVYLIVGGIFGAVKNMINFRSRCRTGEGESGDSLPQKPHDNILNCFLLIWFIAGCVWIYRVYEPEYEDTDSAFYCNKTVYLFAFWLVTTAFIVTGLISVCVMCFVVSSVLSNV